MNKKKQRAPSGQGRLVSILQHLICLRKAKIHRQLEEVINYCQTIADLKQLCDSIRDKDEITDRMLSARLEQLERQGQQF